MGRRAAGGRKGLPAAAALAALALAPAARGVDAPAPLVRVEVPGVPNFAVVSPGLVRGAQPTAEGFRALRERGVRTIVSLRASHADLVVGAMAGG